MKIQLDESGFTLVEMLITLALGGIVVASIYTTYDAQRKAALVQQEMVRSQQNLRAALYVMTKEIRMAGYDPREVGTGITAAGDGSNGDPLTFTLDANHDGIDNDGDGDIDDLDTDGDIQTVSLDLYDSLGDGDSDIGRKVGAANRQAIAENIDALEFLYLDGDGSVLAPPVDTDRVRAIQVTVVARSDRRDPDYTDTRFYSNLQNQWVLGPQNDGYRRKVLSTQIQCRNLGL